MGLEAVSLPDISGVIPLGTWLGFKGRVRDGVRLRLRLRLRVSG